ncbi:pilus assembly protein PilM [candidate division KSB1 bacterium]|nr:pilus assembly protein PilM [candidate division KSB1 bacterium]
MKKGNDKIFLSFSIERDAIHLVASSSKQIIGLDSKELVQQFDHNGIRSEEILYENSIDILKKMREPYGDRAQKAGIVIGQELVLVKRVPVALGLDDEQVKDQLDWEAKQLCISSPEEFNIVSKRMTQRETGGNQVYLIILVRKKIIQLIHRLIKKADLKLVDVEIDLFANFRLFQANENPKEGETSVLIHLQEDTLTFTVIRDNEYCLSQRLAVKSAGETEEELSEKVVPLILKELKRLVFAHRFGNDIQDLNGVYLLSETPLHLFKQGLASKLPIPVTQINPFMQFAISDKLIHTSNFSESPGKFASALGQTYKHYPALVKKAAAGR